MTYATIHAVRFIVLCAILGVSFLFLPLPKSTQAYFTTNQNAIAIDNGTSGIFLIEYRFGNGKHDLHMPLSVQRGSEKTPGVLSYEILDKAGNSAPGKATGIVLSSTPIEGGAYVTPKGFSERFTLLVVFTPETASQGEYRLQVTQLPFSFDGTQELQLNPSELQYYTTELLTLR